MSVERVNASTLPREDHERIVNAWNPEVRTRQIIERFDAGSELWLAKVEGRLAGFGWTIQGRTMEPHFFPLQSGEVHLFDFFVFPEFRGRGVNVWLVMEILSRLSAESLSRAHIECAAWNEPQLRSLAKTSFRRYAVAVKLRVLGRTVVLWHRATPPAV